VSVLLKIDAFISRACPDESEQLLDMIKEDLTILGFKEENQKLSEKIDDFEYKEAGEIATLLIELFASNEKLEKKQ
jgi:hypothetical protein